MKSIEEVVRRIRLARGHQDIHRSGKEAVAEAVVAAAVEVGEDLVELVVEVVSFVGGYLDVVALVLVGVEGPNLDHLVHLP